MNSVDCLAHTGSPLWIMIAVGLSCVLAGLTLLRLPIVRFVGVFALVLGATLAVQSSHSPTATAAANGASGCSSRATFACCC